MHPLSLENMLLSGIKLSGKVGQRNRHFAHCLCSYGCSEVVGSFIEIIMVCVTHTCCMGSIYEIIKINNS